jgi:hypothetical protein
LLQLLQVEPAHPLSTAAGRALPAPLTYTHLCCALFHKLAIPGAACGVAHQGSCCRRHAPLPGAWWRQALPAGGLHQGSCYRRHTPLPGAWRRQAVPAGGLQQGSCYRRHTPLPGAWRRQAVPAGGLQQGSRESSRQHALHAMSAAHTARRCGGAVILRTRPGTQLARTQGDPAAGGGLRINQCTAEARLLISCICTLPLP